MIAHKKTESIKADDYFHVHVVPKGNATLLHKKYPYHDGLGMVDAWKGMLKKPEKYLCISPEGLFAGIDKGAYKELVDYLCSRYW